MFADGVGESGYFSTALSKDDGERDMCMLDCRDKECRGVVEMLESEICFLTVRAADADVRRDC